VELFPLPEGEEVLAAHFLIKTRDADGHVGWYTRVTREYNRVEFLGALLAYTDHLRQEEASDWASDDDAPQESDAAPHGPGPSS
jgi:hypothetical protein